jgi:hypothetical protein
MINATTSTSALQRDLDQLWRWWSAGQISDSDALLLSEAIESELNVASSRCRRTDGSSRRPMRPLDTGGWSRGSGRSPEGGDELTVGDPRKPL